MYKCLETRLARLALGLVAALSITAAFAHHSARITYDMDTVIEIQGEITGLTWRNPHVRFTLSGVDEDNDPVTWNVESIPVTRLNRVGITREMLGIGDTVTVAVYPAKRPVRDVNAINMLLADGREARLDTPVARWTDNTRGYRARRDARDAWRRRLPGNLPACGAPMVHSCARRRAFSPKAEHSTTL